MKYIIVYLPIPKFFLPIVFSDEFSHVIMASAAKYEHKDSQVLGAGFLDQNRKIKPGEKSGSLNIGPSEDDQTILDLFFERGLSGLALNNMLLYRQLTGEDYPTTQRESQ